MSAGRGWHSALLAAYRMRWKRRRLLWRGLQARHALRVIADRTEQRAADSILCLSTVRNECRRLPYFLTHYRRLGVGHFLFVDNGSTDDTQAFLAEQPDVSLWTTGASYKAARFGVDWLTWLQIRYGHGHWCLTADADELLVIPHMEHRGLGDLTAWLGAQGVPAFGAMMLDMYPKGPVADQTYTVGDDPARTLNWFDGWGYTWERQLKYGNISIRGGPRQRLFFADCPDFAPHLHKVPLVRWNRRYAYVSSTHIALPRRLNAVFDARSGMPTGIFLHTKFLDEIVDKSVTEKTRGEHFTHADRYDEYYDRLSENPTLWHTASERYQGWQHMESLGLMTRGDWSG